MITVVIDVRNKKSKEAKVLCFAFTVTIALPPLFTTKKHDCRIIALLIFFFHTRCCHEFEIKTTDRVLRSGEDCSIMDNDFPDFIMNENYLDQVMCMEHRLYSISMREPVSRAMSQESHVWHFDQKHAPNYLNLTERLELAQNNYMMWSLSSGHIVGVDDADPVTSKSPLTIVLERVHLAIAKDKLSRFDFIVDVIELSKNMAHANSREGKERTQKLEYEKDEYVKRNTLDIELYRFALTLIKVDCEFFVRVLRNTTND